MISIRTHSLLKTHSQVSSQVSLNRLYHHGIWYFPVIAEKRCSMFLKKGRIKKERGGLIHHSALDQGQTFDVYFCSLILDLFLLKSGGQTEIIITLCNLLVVSVVYRLKGRNSFTVKIREERDRKQSKKLTFKTFKDGTFWQQDITPDRKSFVTQSKHIF